MAYLRRRAEFAPTASNFDIVDFLMITRSVVIMHAVAVGPIRGKSANRFLQASSYSCSVMPWSWISTHQLINSPSISVTSLFITKLIENVVATVMVLDLSFETSLTSVGVRLTFISLHFSLPLRPPRPSQPPTTSYP